MGAGIIIEHTELDISNINYGNFCLGQWLENESLFVNKLIHSETMRICLVNVYGTLVKLKELPKFDKLNQDTFNETLKRSKDWDATSSGIKGVQLMKSILVLDKLAEKKLAVTAGI